MSIAEQVERYLANLRRAVDAQVGKLDAVEIAHQLRRAGLRYTSLESGAAEPLSGWRAIQRRREQNGLPLLKDSGRYWSEYWAGASRDGFRYRSQSDGTVLLYRDDDRLVTEEELERLRRVGIVVHGSPTGERQVSTLVIWPEENPTLCVQS